MAPERRDARSDSPQVVTVEVTVASHGRPRRSAARRGLALAIGAIAALGALAAIMAVAVSGPSARHADPVTARGPAGVAAAYGYPLGCMSVKIPAADRTYARADLTHAAGCGGITGYAPAFFHYVAGRWRLVPNAIGYMCNPDVAPAAVVQGLDLCVGPIGPRAKLPNVTGVV
jgi:hypothetical protein